VNFAGFLYAWITVSNAARTGAQYLSFGGAYLSSPGTPNASQVRTLVLNDLHHLPNSSGATVTVCSRVPSNSTLASSITCDGPGTYSPPRDANAEASHYAMGSVDVVYTYSPFIAMFDFSNLGIHLTLLPSNRIHRQGSMRILQ
jgi:hypothetical protein